jgi:hypothetical protein
MLSMKTTLKNGFWHLKVVIDVVRDGEKVYFVDGASLSSDTWNTR